LTQVAAAAAAELRRKQGAELVIALLHGGDPEDRTLAKVPGIDLVIAGHTHRLYETPHQEGKVLIAQAGCYGRYLGKLELNLDAGTLRLRNSGATHLEVDARVHADPTVISRLAEYRREIDEVQNGTGLRYDTHVTQVQQDLKHDNSPNPRLGVFVTSRILGSLNGAMPAAARPIDVYFTSPSLIREDWVRAADKPTAYQFSDIFRLLPIGFGRDFRPGSPIVSFFLTRREAKLLINAAELERKVTGKPALTYSDSLSFRVRSFGIPFVNRITDLKLHGNPYREWPELVHVASIRYVTAFMPRIQQLTHGLVSISPRDAEGRVIAEPMELPVPGEAVLFARSFRN
jgi:hypothetical protein